MPISERYGTKLPTVGIRILVDGRQNGVRKHLEQPTAEMAENVKRLIEENLRYPDGQLVECVIGSRSIGGIKEAALVSEEFREKNVGAIISVSRAFAYSTELIETDPTIPQAIWGVNSTERPGAVFLAAAASAHNQMRLPVFKIYGHDVQNGTDSSCPSDVAEKILLFVRCALALAMMKNKSYLSVGGVCMGIGASVVDPDFFRCYLGMRNEYVDMSEVARRIDNGIYDQNEYKRALRWVKDNCILMDDPNAAEWQRTSEQKEKDWEDSVKLAIVLRDLMVGNKQLAAAGYSEEAHGHYAIAAGFQGQRNWSDYRTTGDFAETILNSSFDWDGRREPLVIATENDSLNAVTMLMGHLLTGEAQIFADVRTYWSKNALEKICDSESLPEELLNGIIYLTNSGAAAVDGCLAATANGRHCMKPSWEMTEEDIDRCMRASRWAPVKTTTFRGGGYSVSYLTRADAPMTMVRLNLVSGLGPSLQIIEGRSVELPGDLQEKIIRRTDPTWPKTFFVPRLTGTGKCSSVYEIMNVWGANHCSLCYGHRGKEFITLASMLRIPVSIHNIDEADIFRPSAWDLFGDPADTDTDFRACRNYSALYGKY